MSPRGSASWVLLSVSASAFVPLTLMNPEEKPIPNRTRFPILRLSLPQSTLCPNKNYAAVTSSSHACRGLVQNLLSQQSGARARVSPVRGGVVLISFSMPLARARDRQREGKTGRESKEKRKTQTENKSESGAGRSLAFCRNTGSAFIRITRG